MQESFFSFDHRLNRWDRRWVYARLNWICQLWTMYQRSSSRSKYTGIGKISAIALIWLFRNGKRRIFSSQCTRYSIGAAVIGCAITVICVLLGIFLMNFTRSYSVRCSHHQLSFIFVVLYQVWIVWDKFFLILCHKKIISRLAVNLLKQCTSSRISAIIHQMICAAKKPLCQCLKIFGCITVIERCII